MTFPKDIKSIEITVKLRPRQSQDREVSTDPDPQKTFRVFFLTCIYLFYKLRTYLNINVNFFTGTQRGSIQCEIKKRSF